MFLKFRYINIGLNHRINQYFSLGIFICTFLYIYFALCYIVYDIFTISPVFLWTKDFFLQHVTRPFIFTNYISLFFIQFFTTRFAGALILSFLATLFFIVFRKILSGAMNFMKKNRAVSMIKTNILIGYQHGSLIRKLIPPSHQGNHQHITFNL